MKMSTQSPPQIASRRFDLSLVAVYAVGVVLRLAWLIRVGWDAAGMQFKGVPVLTSPDGYWFATGAGQALTGGWAADADLPQASHHALVALGTALTQLTPWSLDEIALILPAILGPLIAIPVALIGRRLGSDIWGLAAALIVVSAPGFVIRTNAGYFDTDVFAVFIPLMAIAGLVQLVAQDRVRGLAWAGFWLAVYPFFYDRGWPVSGAVVGLCLVWFVLRFRQRPWFLLACGVLVASQAPAFWPLRLVLVAVVYGLLCRIQPPQLVRSPWVPAVAGPAVLAALAAVWPEFWAKLTFFVDGAVSAGAAGPDSLTIFGDSAVSVAEARVVPFDTLGNRVAGAWPLFIVGCVGAGAAFIRVRALLPLLAIAAVGSFAAFGGIRFGIYLSPVIALGVGYGAAAAVERFAGGLPHLVRRACVVATIVIPALPGVARSWVTVASPSLTGAEADLMDRVAHQTAPGSMTIAWWDYGYALRYFARHDVLVDGGVQGADVSLVAEVLLSPSQATSAGLAIASAGVAHEVKEQGWAVAPTLFQQASGAGLSTEEYLVEVARGVAPPPDGQDVYLFLPTRDLARLGHFAGFRPRSGGARPKGPGFYRFYQGVSRDGALLTLPGAQVVDTKTGVITGPTGARNLRTLHAVRGAGIGHKHRKRTLHPWAPTSGIYLDDINAFIELDAAWERSTVIELLVFQAPEPEVWTLVAATAAGAVYRANTN